MTKFIFKRITEQKEFSKRQDDIKGLTKQAATLIEKYIKVVDLGIRNPGALHHWIDGLAWSINNCNVDSIKDPIGMAFYYLLTKKEQDKIYKGLSRDAMEADILVKQEMRNLVNSRKYYNIGLRSMRDFRVTEEEILLGLKDLYQFLRENCRIYDKSKIRSLLADYFNEN